MSNSSSSVIASHYTLIIFVVPLTTITNVQLCGKESILIGAVPCVLMTYVVPIFFGSGQ